jgi:hypothetical protein
MKTKNLEITFAVDKSPMEVYDAINNVREWWSDGLEGKTHQVGDEFTYRHKDLHYSKHSVTELIPGKKVVWLVTDSQLTFIKDQSEWNQTKIIFDISEKASKTQVKFTHEGLVEACECFEACSGAWTFYLKDSLGQLITKGKGQPDTKAEYSNTVA